MSDLLTIADAEAPAKKMTSHDLKNGLRLSRGDGYQVFFEVGNDTGTRVTRHADAVAIGIWPSTGHQIHGYEIKVSRGDFLNEMKNPKKAWPVMRFCHRWSLLTPPGLVKVDELPPNWGLQTYDGRVMRTVKQAPMLEPEAPTGGFMAALVRRAGTQDGELIAAAVAKEKADWQADSLRQSARQVDYDIKAQIERGDSAIEIVKGIKEALGVQHLHPHDLVEIAPVIKAVRASGVARQWQGLSQLSDELATMADKINEQMAELGIAERRKRKRA